MKLTHLRVALHNKDIGKMCRQNAASDLGLPCLH